MAGLRQSPGRRVDALCGALAFLSLIGAMPALAQSAPEQSAATPEPQQPSPEPKTASPKPEPPPNIPLFPRSRRGLYKNGLGLWVIDGPPQSPPLFTDDPGVPDKGVYEINFTTSADLASSATNVDLLLVDANYGLLPRVLGHDLPMQLKLEGPVSASKQAGQSLSAGLGAFAAGVKVQAYGNDNQGIEVSVYPQVEFGMGSTFVEKGLVDAGQTFVFPVLVSKQFRYVTTVFNGGIERPINAPDRLPIGTASAAVGLAIQRHLALMAELRFQSAFHARDDRMALVNGGVLRSLGHYAVLYGNVGGSIWTADGESHLFVGVGLKVLIAADRNH